MTNYEDTDSDNEMTDSDNEMSDDQVKSELIATNERLFDTEYYASL